MSLSNCTSNSRCDNIDGDFTCTCNTGYTGNAYEIDGCQGKFYFNIIIIVIVVVNRID